jgi:CheY-like chemotaxis protein
MPGMDGLQLLGEIKQRFPDLPVMMVTAHGDDERRRRARELGAFEFITKPVDFDQLSTQLTRTDWPLPVSVAAGSQRHERAGWNGPAPLLSLLAAGSNALAPHGRGKGRDVPRRRRALTPAG